MTDCFGCSRLRTCPESTDIIVSSHIVVTTTKLQVRSDSSRNDPSTHQHFPCISLTFPLLPAQLIPPHPSNTPNADQPFIVPSIPHASKIANSVTHAQRARPFLTSSEDPTPIRRSLAHRVNRLWKLPTGICRQRPSFLAISSVQRSLYDDQYRRLCGVIRSSGAGLGGTFGGLVVTCLVQSGL
jgi:hypothetical protein